MDKTISFLAIVIPSIMSLLAIWYTYKITTVQKKTDERELERKKLRETVSNLMLIWREFDVLEKFIADIKPTERFMFKIPVFAKNILDIDRGKIEVLKNAFLECLIWFKQNNVSQFYRLETSFASFSDVLTDVFNPILDDNQIDVERKVQYAFPFIGKIAEDVQAIILEAIVRLPKNEQKEIKDIFANKIEKPKPPDKVSQRFMELVNSKFALHHPLQIEEVTVVFKNPTIMFLMNKILCSPGAHLLIPANASKMFSLFFKFADLTAFEDKEFIGKLKQVITSIEFSEEENSQFLNNKSFYKIILGLCFKMTGKVSWEMKKAIVGLNSGSIRVSDELEKVKAEFARGDLSGITKQDILDVLGVK
jgi:hypothetical protein